MVDKCKKFSATVNDEYNCQLAQNYLAQFSQFDFGLWYVCIHNKQTLK